MSNDGTTAAAYPTRSSLTDSIIDALNLDIESPHHDGAFKLTPEQITHIRAFVANVTTSGQPAEGTTDEPRDIKYYVAAFDYMWTHSIEAESRTEFGLIQRVIACLMEEYSPRQRD